MAFPLTLRAERALRLSACGHMRPDFKDFLGSEPALRIVIDGRTPHRTLYGNDTHGRQAWHSTK
jgi:hypothetical protein